MPDCNGLDVLRTIAADRLRCRTVLVTAALDDDDVIQAVELGAAGIVLKESSPDTLIECVRKVHSGDRWIDHDMLGRAFQRVLERKAAAREAGKSLTPRELEIVRMIARGLRNKVVADQMSITEGTVKIHLHRIYENLGVNGRLELVLYAQQNGLA